LAVARPHGPPFREERPDGRQMPQQEFRDRPVRREVAGR